MNDDKNNKTTEAEVLAEPVVPADTEAGDYDGHVVGSVPLEIQSTAEPEAEGESELSSAEERKLRKEQEKAAAHAEKVRLREEEEAKEAEVIKAVIAEHAREDEQPLSPNLTLKKILGGDILSAQLFRNNIKLILLIVGFVIVYITNRYSVQKDLIEIDKLNTELEDAKYRALSSSSQLTEKSRESHVLELLKTNKDSVLKMAAQPPYKIEVPKK
ncbi:FtsL-like putative cell division protein [Prevotella dentasini]|uniref:FtsL-like putative cell division protein n=1 Tax=Prevotella dentasini TaxID=589537 RepID=UPI0004690509|nr:FtsL-like putative cell division protein [Prevotella dentasini]